MKTLLCAFLLLLLSGLGFAQDTAKLTDKPKAEKAAPAEVSVSLESTQRLEIVTQAAEIQKLRADNWQSQIERAEADIRNARAELTKMRESERKARDEADSALIHELGKRGVSPDLVKEYQGLKNEKGEMIFRRIQKPAAAAPPSN